MSGQKRLHPDEVIVLDDDDDAADNTEVPESSEVPVLARIDSTQPAATVSAPAQKRVRPDNVPHTQQPSTPKAAHSTTTITSAVAQLSPHTPSSARGAPSVSTPARLPPVPSASPPPAVSSYTFTGMYQPHRFITDDSDENKYVIAAAYLLFITLKWNDSHSTAAVQGRISWRFGLMWLNFDALMDDRETLFWDVARQSETITGQAQRVHERATEGRADDRVRLVLATRELLPIDASISQFHDEEGDEDETTNQVQYTLEQFERQRHYMLEVQHDTRLTGTITLQLQPTFGDRKEEDEEDEEQGRETSVVGWACDECEAETDNELLPVQRVHNSLVARMLDLFTAQNVTPDVVNKLRGMLDRVLKEPEVDGSKSRRINSTKVAAMYGEVVVDVLKLCGYVEDEVENMGQQYVVLPNHADLLLVATMRRALPS